MADSVNDQLLAAGLKRVVQCARGSERDPFGGPLRTTWLDTDWESIEDAQSHHPEYIYRNTIIGGEDEQFEAEVVPQFTYTYNDIKNMSASEYRHRLTTQPGFMQYADSLIFTNEKDIKYVDNTQNLEPLKGTKGEENAEKLNEARATSAEQASVAHGTWKEKLQDELEKAGIPLKRFRGMEDCGCGLGAECTIKR